MTTPSSIRAKRSRTSGPQLGFALLLAALLSGCVGSGLGLPDAAGNSGEVPQSFAEIEVVIFEPMCALQCHRGGAAPKGLSLEPGRAAAQLVGVPSVEVPAMLRVAPGAPQDSYLMAKIVQFDGRRVGARMPRNGPPYLTTAQIGAIRRWITAGAANDWVDTGELIDAGIADAAPLDDAMSVFDAAPTYDAVPILDASALHALPSDSE